MRAVKIFLFFLMVGNGLYAQTDIPSKSPIEIIVIDSYITPETPHKFLLSFFTSERSISKIILMKKTTLEISNTYTEDHKIEIDLSKMDVHNSLFYQISATDSSGNITNSEVLEANLPVGIEISGDQDPGLFSICLGAVIFTIPSPTAVSLNGVNHWSLNKEIPIVNFYSAGYNYPSGYIGLEYSHIFDTDRRNYLRLGYKQIIQIPVIEYFAPGVGAFTDLNGYNGLSAELSIGLFQIQNVFTLYTRYRYNFQTINGGREFHELSIGLYSNFFSLNL